jgi:hypothetical protein
MELVRRLSRTGSSLGYFDRFYCAGLHIRNWLSEYHLARNTILRLPCLRLLSLEAPNIRDIWLTVLGVCRPSV